MSVWLEVSLVIANTLFTLPRRLKSWFYFVFTPNSSLYIRISE